MGKQRAIYDICISLASKKSSITVRITNFYQKKKKCNWCNNFSLDKRMPHYSRIYVATHTIFITRSPAPASKRVRGISLRLYFLIEFCLRFQQKLSTSCCSRAAQLKLEDIDSVLSSPLNARVCLLLATVTCPTAVKSDVGSRKMCYRRGTGNTNNIGKLQFVNSSSCLFLV
jgi:hypothetical protein